MMTAAYATLGDDSASQILPGEVSEPGDPRFREWSAMHHTVCITLIVFGTAIGLYIILFFVSWAMCGSFRAGLALKAFFGGIAVC